MGLVQKTKNVVAGLWSAVKKNDMNEETTNLLVSEALGYCQYISHTIIFHDTSYIFVWKTCLDACELVQ